MKARVYVLYVGGTIGMAPASPSIKGSPLVPKPLQELMPYVPGLDSLNIELGYGTLERPLDSSDMTPANWLEIADRIQSEYANWDGFVILHGTDTLAYTASALAFVLENLAKPVVITGSQLPISDVRTDAKLNLVNAICVAGYKAVDLPCIPEVVVVFADKILRGCRGRKLSSQALAGFDSPNFPPLGTIGESIDISERLIRQPPPEGARLQVHRDLSDRVLQVSLHPGINPKYLEGILTLDNIDAFVLQTFGAGNAPSHPAFLEVIQTARARSKTIVNVTQCIEGMVEQGLYQSSSRLQDLGVISCLDMTPEAALTKLMWTLGSQVGDQVAAQMQVNQRGEQSENLFDLRFGSAGSVDQPVASFRDFRTPDRRLTAHRLTRATLRLSGLGIASVQPGDSAVIRIFMNLASADSQTTSQHDRCIAELSIPWTGQPIDHAVQLDDTRLRSILGESDVLLSVVSRHPFWFSGLHLTLLSKVGGQPPRN
jgi:L-asparaginase